MAPGPDRRFALAQYKARAARYDNELAPFEPVRVEAIRQLRLRRGQGVIDVGCGTGLSFAGLEEGVGRRGRVVGIEQSPEMLALAQGRVEAAGWRNVHLVGAPAASARFEGEADAALFVFTHDVLREHAAVDNVLSHLKPGARVVAAGLQWAPPWMWPVNSFVLGAALYSVTSLEGLGNPWSLLAKRLEDVEVTNTLFGGIYVAAGTYPGPH